MVLPRSGDEILLQSFQSGEDKFWDGFGSFYTVDEKPVTVARRVAEEYFGQSLSKTDFRKRAQLQYFIEKPDAFVELNVIVYFVEVAKEQINTDNFRWFTQQKIPYSNMHAATQQWLPILLNKPKLLTATIRIHQPGTHSTGEIKEFLEQ